MKTMEDAVIVLKKMSEKQYLESLLKTAHGDILQGRELMLESLGLRKSYALLVEVFPDMNDDDVEPETIEAKPAKPKSKTAKPRTNKPKVKAKAKAKK